MSGSIFSEPQCSNDSNIAVLTFGWRELAFGRRGKATLGSIC